MVIAKLLASMISLFLYGDGFDFARGEAVVADVVVVVVVAPMRAPVVPVVGVVAAPGALVFFSLPHERVNLRTGLMFYERAFLFYRGDASLFY